MSFDEIYEALAKKLPKAILEKGATKPDPYIKVEAKQIREVVSHMKREMSFETLGCVSGVDQLTPPALWVVYHMVSYRHKCVVALKVELPRTGEPAIDTISDLYKAANWLERETFDMFGIRFTGHPDMRRILMPDDWEGYPLRKDFVTPDYYNGMPVPLFFEDTAEKGGQA